MTDIVYAQQPQATGAYAQDLGGDQALAAVIHQQLSSFRGTPVQLVMAQRMILKSPAGALYIEQLKTKALQEVAMAKSMFAEDVSAVNAFDAQFEAITAIK